MEVEGKTYKLKSDYFRIEIVSEIEIPDDQPELKSDYFRIEIYASFSPT